MVEKIAEKETHVREGSRSRALGGKYLTFFLNTEEYGLMILKVQEIIGMMPVTPVPHAPDFIEGVINLRGKVIPVMDLRRKFGMEGLEHTDETCIIVVQSNRVEMGVVVDKVSEVLDVVESEIDEAPLFGADVDTDFLLGIDKSNNRVKLLLDIDKVLNQYELKAVQNIAASVESAKNE